MCDDTLPLGGPMSSTACLTWVHRSSISRVPHQVRSYRLMWWMCCFYFLQSIMLHVLEDGKEVRGLKRVGHDPCYRYHASSFM